MNEEFRTDRHASPVAGWEMNAAWFPVDGFPNKGMITLTVLSGDGMRIDECLPDIKTRNVLCSLVLPEPHDFLEEISHELEYYQRGEFSNEFDNKMVDQAEGHTVDNINRENERALNTANSTVDVDVVVQNVMNSNAIIKRNKKKTAYIEKLKAQLRVFRHLHSQHLLTEFGSPFTIEDANQFLKTQTKILWNYMNNEPHSRQRQVHK